ncbi:hypothetical protein SKAU_G00003740, partial [Synaphobranchus kaupii]
MPCGRVTALPVSTPLHRRKRRTADSTQTRVSANTVSEGQPYSGCGGAVLHSLTFSAHLVPNFQAPFPPPPYCLHPQVHPRRASSAGVDCLPQAFIGEQGWICPTEGPGRLAPGYRLVSNLRERAHSSYSVRRVSRAPRPCWRPLFSPARPPRPLVVKRPRSNVALDTRRTSASSPE